MDLKSATIAVPPQSQRTELKGDAFRASESDTYTIHNRHPTPDTDGSEKELTMSLKRTFFATLVAVAALAVPAGPALAWTNPGNHTFTGTLTSTLNAPGGASTINCDVTFDTTVDENGSVAPAVGNNPFTVDSGTALNCTSSITGCTVTVALQGLVPAIGARWLGFGQNASGGSGPISINRANFVATFGDATCIINTVQVDVRGSVGAAYDDTTGNVTLSTTTAETMIVADSGSAAGIPIGTDVSIEGTVTTGAPLPALE